MHALVWTYGHCNFACLDIAEEGNKFFCNGVLKVQTLLALLDEDKSSLYFRSGIILACSYLIQDLHNRKEAQKGVDFDRQRRRLREQGLDVRNEPQSKISNRIPRTTVFQNRKVSFVPGISYRNPGEEGSLHSGIIQSFCNHGDSL